MVEKFTENVTKGEVGQTPCGKCNIETNHVVLTSIETDGRVMLQSKYGEDRDLIDWRENFQIIKCQGCDSISFRHFNWNSEDYCEDYSYTVRIYPHRDLSSLKKKDFWGVPNNLRHIYKEVIDSFNNNCFILCAAGIRALVEGICANKSIKHIEVEQTKKDGTIKKIKKSDLEGKIMGLHQKGFLTENNANILHEHRYLGNDAVHELAMPSTTELRLAIEIVESTLEQLYELPEKHLELKKRREHRKNTKTTQMDVV